MILKQVPVRFGCAINFETRRNIPELMQHTEFIFMSEILIVKGVAQIHEREKVGVFPDKVCFRFVSCPESDVPQILVLLHDFGPGTRVRVKGDGTFDTPHG